MGGNRRPTGQALHVLRVFNQATAAELQAGLSWYKTMGEMVIRRMRAANREHKCGYTLTRQACLGVVAALSPQKAWVVNMNLADALVIRRNAGTYKSQVKKALAILDGENPLDVLSGQKERSFYLCFLNPHSSREVTVDGHALNAWLGVYLSVEKTRVTPRLYDLARADYREVAEMMDLLPHQVQATVWLAWRRLNASPAHSMDRNHGL